MLHGYRIVRATETLRKMHALIHGNVLARILLDSCTIVQNVAKLNQRPIVTVN